jgi:uncharacterized protein (TIGR04222 family)
MDTAHQELWRRIEAFELDEPGAARPFSARLAEEQGWAPARARNVVAEYKRFAFLAVAAGHPVTPSKAVDEAWHLHLIHTRGYWEKFCPLALGRPLHHEPTRGGAAEEEKHAGQYRATRASYCKFFGEEPPPEIWPDPDDISAPRPPSDGLPSWLPGALRPRPAATGWLLGGLMLLGLAGCAGAATGWPFDLRGPEFLGFYLWFAPAMLLLAFGLRWRLRGPAPRAMNRPPDLDALMAALLAGGPGRAVGTAVADLSVRGLARVDMKTGTVHALGVLSAREGKLETLIHGNASGPGGIKWKGLRDTAKSALAPEMEKLRRLGLVLSEDAATRAWLASGAVVLVLLAVAGAKVFIGIERNRPVGFLLVLGGITFVLSLIFFARRPWRSRAGDFELSDLKIRHARLKRKPTSTGDPEFPLAVALFGAAVLPGDYKRWFDRQNPASLSGGGSGCGSSGCGGGGCGGGGCGGGCGGCGGGGD